MAELDLNSDKSLEDFGSALLARKESQSKKRRKERRKAQLPMKLLTAGLGLSAVFQNAAKRRISEIENNNKLDLLNSKTEAPKYVAAASLVQPLQGFTGNVEDFKKDKQKYNEFLSVSRGFIDPYIKAGNVHGQFGYATHEQYLNALPSSYNHIVEVGSNALLEQLLSDTPEGKKSYQGIINAMQQVTPEEMGESELIKSIAGLDLSGNQLSIYKTQKALNESTKFKKQGSLRNIVDNTKNALSSIGILNEQEGGLNLFKAKNFDENKLVGGTLSDVIDAAGFDVTVKGTLQEYVTNFKDSPKRYINSVTSADVKNTGQLLENLAARVERGEKYDPTDSFDFFESTQLRRMIENMKDDHPLNYAALLQDGSILGNMIHDRPKLGRAMHEEDVLLDVQAQLKSGEIKTPAEAIQETKRRLDLFERRITDDKNFATQYATLKMLDTGKASPVDGKFYNMSKETSYLGTTDLIYNHDNRVNAFTKFMNETVQYDRQNDRYSFSSEYLKDKTNEEVQTGINMFIRRSYLEESLNEANDETLQFLTDINASKYYNGARPEEIQAAIVQQLFR